VIERKAVSGLWRLGANHSYQPLTSNHQKHNNTQFIQKKSTTNVKTSTQAHWKNRPVVTFLQNCSLYISQHFKS